MTKDAFTELFTLQAAGNLAAAFMYSGVTPSEDQWGMLRGHREMTMRDIGEIGHITSIEMNLTLRRSQHLESPTQEPSK